MNTRSTLMLALALALVLAPASGPRAQAADPCDVAFKLRKYGKVAESCRTQAEAGEAEAQYRMAFVHGRGVGVRLDHRAAAGWYARAAEQGHAKAQGRLGTYYFYGKGVTQDLVQAYTLLSLAAEREAGTFRPARDEVKRKMSESQIAEAESRIEAWKKAH